MFTKSEAERGQVTGLRLRTRVKAITQVWPLSTVFSLTKIELPGVKAAGFGEVSEANFLGQSSQRSQVIQAWGGSRNLWVAERPEQWTPEQWPRELGLAC